MTSARSALMVSVVRWRTLEPLLDAALALPPERRSALLDDQCGADSSMRQELEHMLKACERLEQSAGPLERPAAERFASLWNDEERATVARVEIELAGRYALDSETGRGGMAIVYRARDLRHERLVALKVLRPALIRSASLRFRREIGLAANLQHPHILPVFDSGESDGHLWYTMPFVDGETLGVRLRRDGRLSIPDAVRLLREIADALHYAHTHGVVHRDLKPDNVLLSGEHAVIADFGVAKALAAATDDDAPAIDGNVDFTGAGETVGTPAYMAPEQAAGDASVDHRADLYALGVIGYQLLTGTPPFAGSSRLALVAAHRAERPVPVSTHRTEVSPELERLVMHLLQKRPADRPRSAAEVIARLDALDTSPRRAGELPPAAIGREARSRWRLVATVAAISALAVATGLAFRTTRMLRPVRRVIVIPFENATGDTSAAQFGRVASQWIAEGLSTKDFIEIASDVATPRSATTVDLAAAGVSSAAGLVISGSFYVLGDSIRAQLMVIDVATRTRLTGSSPVTGARTEQMTILDQLGKQVLAILTPRLDPRMAGWSMGALPKNIDALDAFIRGLDLMSQGHSPGAIASWKRAAALDSTYMQPRLHAAAVLQEFEPASADSLLTVVEQRRSVLTQGDLAMLAYIRGGLDGDPSAGVEAAERFVRAEPNAQLPYFFLSIALIRRRQPQEAIDAAGHVTYQSGRFRHSSAASLHFFVVTEAYHQLGDHLAELDQARIARRLHLENRDIVSLELRALAALGRWAEMEPLLAQLDEMAPLSGPAVPTLLVMIAGELNQHGQPTAADRVLERAVAWRPRFPRDQQQASTQYDRGRALYALGRYREAEPIFETLIRLPPTDPFYPTYLAYRAAIARQRRNSDVEHEMIARLEGFQRRYDRGMTAHARAQLAAQSGDTTRALAFLEQSLKQGISARRVSFHADLMLAPVWRNPRLQALVRPKG